MEEGNHSGELEICGRHSDAEEEKNFYGILCCCCHNEPSGNAYMSLRCPEEEILVLCCMQLIVCLGNTW